MQQRLGLVAEERDQDELLLARGQPFGLGADVLRARRILVQRHAVGQQRDRSRDGCVDLARRLAVAALHQRSELVDDRAVAARREDVDQRLRREDLANRGGEGRPACLAADQRQLVQHLEQAIVGGVRAELAVEGGDETRREVVLGRAHGEARRKWRDRDVLEVLVDEVGALPQPGHVDACSHPHPGQRRGERLAGDTVERERERVERAGDQVGAGARRLERVGETRARRALTVEADRKPGCLGDLGDELAALMGLEPAGGIVDQRSVRAELSKLLRLLDERMNGVVLARAVDEARVELLAGADDRLARLAEVGDVVERIVEPEDVDPVLGRRGDEAADEVGADRPASRRGSDRGGRARAASSSAT